MRAVGTALLTLFLSSGCELILVGGPVEKQDRSNENDAEENLKAIRKVLEDQGTRPVEQPSGPSSEAAPFQSLSASSEPSVSDGFPLSAALSPVRPAPSPSSAGHANVPAKIPWTPTAPQRPSDPDRLVPAYTTPAPVAPGYSGAIRCVPDGMGGQRCLGR